MKAWANSLGGVNYPLLSDFWPHGEVAQKYGVLRKDGFTERAIFIIDQAGVLRYIDIHNIAEQPSNDVLFAELAQIVPDAEKILTAEDVEIPHGGIVMYCTPWCGDCKQARAWLAEHKIAYREVDISRNRKAAAQVRRWANGNETTPTFDIDGKIIVDFKVEELEKALLKSS